jgi:hypothetical protein
VLAAWVPYSAVIWKVGRRAASATPIRAVAAAYSRSACSTSGRR